MPAAGKGDKRKPYSILAAIAAGVLCVLVCLDGLGENGMAPAHLLNIEASGWSDCWLDFFDCVAEGILMPLGALLMCICIGWELGPPDRGRRVLPGGQPLQEQDLLQRVREVYHPHHHDPDSGRSAGQLLRPGLVLLMEPNL